MKGFQATTLLMAALTSSSSAMTERDLAERCIMQSDVSDVVELCELWKEWKVRVRAMGKRGPSHGHQIDFELHVVSLLNTVLCERSFMTVEAANGGMWFVATAYAPFSTMQVKACCEGFEVRGLAGTCHVEVHYYEPRSYHAHVLMNNDNEAEQGGWRINVCAYAPQGGCEITELPRDLQMDYDCASPENYKTYMLAKWDEQPDLFTGEFADTRQMPGGWMDPARFERARIQAARMRAWARQTQRQIDSYRSSGTRQFDESVSAAIANAISAPRAVATPAPSAVASPSAKEAAAVVCLPFMCKQMFALTSDHTCVVCQEETTESTHRALSCGHFLCCECLDRVLAMVPKQRLCPICRVKISKN